MPATDTLEGMMDGYEPYEARFLDAKKLARDIFTRHAPAGIQIISTETSYYDDHGIGHVERVILKLDVLKRLLSKPLDRKEAFVLLVATCLHDVSMFLGRRQGETEELVRSEHHIRSAEAILTLNGQFLHIPSEEIEAIQNVIRAHRVVDLQTLTESQMIEGSEIRTRLLGALLRIADACDCDRSRAPRVIFDLFYENIPESSREYWKMHFSITDVRFEDKRSSIVVSVNFTGNLKERIEKCRMANLLKKRITHELEGVKAVFRSNMIPLVRVEIQDFSSGEFVDFSSPPTYGNFLTVTLCSDFARTDDFVNVIAPYISSTSDAVPFVIEFRPPEGPLFVDAAVHISSERQEEMESHLQETLGSDLWGLRGEIIEKVTLRRGIAS